MDNTGRINKLLNSEARYILFDKNIKSSLDNELKYGIEVDCAHIIMLAEQNLISINSASKLLSLIEHLKISDFNDLKNKEAKRGTYLLYEDYLIEKLGMEIAGNLQLGRSRNDRNATIFKLKFRNEFVRLFYELLSLENVILSKAEKHKTLLMPIYTHYQAAQPTTLGHYFSSIGTAIERELSQLYTLFSDLNKSPLGAGAINGTTLKINSTRTAELLGFTNTNGNSIDAVASRDIALHTFAILSIIGNVLSRFSHDLQIWSTHEVNLISFPDDLVGSSSMMPQKRNAFLLEHISGRSTAPLGLFVSSISAQHCTPYSNSIAVGTESISDAWVKFDEFIDTIILTRILVEGVIPNANRMAEIAWGGNTYATTIADYLVLYAKIPFREAHKIVGSIIKENDGNDNEAIIKALHENIKSLCPNIDMNLLDPQNIALNSEYGGGSGTTSITNHLTKLNEGISYFRKNINDIELHWKNAKRSLENEIAKIIANSLAEK